MPKSAGTVLAWLLSETAHVAGLLSALAEAPDFAVGGVVPPDAARGDHGGATARSCSALDAAQRQPRSSSPSIGFDVRRTAIQHLARRPLESARHQRAGAASDSRRIARSDRAPSPQSVPWVALPMSQPRVSRRARSDDAAARRGAVSSRSAITLSPRSTDRVGDVARRRRHLSRDPIDDDAARRRRSSSSTLASPIVARLASLEEARELADRLDAAARAAHADGRLAARSGRHHERGERHHRAEPSRRTAAPRRATTIPPGDAARSS